MMTQTKEITQSQQRNAAQQTIYTMTDTLKQGQNTNCSNRVQLLALAVQLHQCIFDINDEGDTALPESRLLIPKSNTDTINM